MDLLLRIRIGPRLLTLQKGIERRGGGNATHYVSYVSSRSEASMKEIVRFFFLLFFLFFNRRVRRH